MGNTHSTKCSDILLAEHAVEIADADAHAQLLELVRVVVRGVVQVLRLPLISGSSFRRRTPSSAAPA